MLGTPLMVSNPRRLPKETVPMAALEQKTLPSTTHLISTTIKSSKSPKVTNLAKLSHISWFVVLIDEIPLVLLELNESALIYI